MYNIMYKIKHFISHVQLILRMFKAGWVPGHTGYCPLGSSSFYC